MSLCVPLAAPVLNRRVHVAEQALAKPVTPGGTNTAKRKASDTSGTRNGQVISTVLADPDRRCPRDQYAGRFLQEETEMTEVNKLVAFSPPLRFPQFAPVPLFSRTANGFFS